MAYEASEIMFAAAMLYTPSELEEKTKDLTTFRNFMVESKKRIQTKNEVKFGSTAIEKGFLDLMDEQKSESLKDLAAGVSAAIAMQNEIGAISKRKTPTLYMTGNVWPQEVEKFRVSAHGFEDYNSADVIVSYDDKMFYGVSLKKKRNSNAGEPTLINKAFDTLLDGNQFSKVKDSLANIRRNYFANLVIEAVDKGLIRKGDIAGFDQLKKTDEGRKELFESKKRDKKIFDRAYIDTKGSSLMKEGYKDDKTNDSKSMRYFVNKKLAEKDNKLWNEFIGVMNQYADLFADSLINVILKTKLFEELEAKDLKKFKFSFFLVTGVGDVSSKGDVKISTASAISLKTTLCGLTRINEMMQNGKYEIVLDEQKKGSSDAAKVFLQLKKGTVTLLDLELRYKGQFTPQPQFQGTINSQFKQLLMSECGLK
jgi:hypothetical protein